MLLPKNEYRAVTFCYKKIPLITISQITDIVLYLVFPLFTLSRCAIRRKNFIICLQNIAKFSKLTFVIDC